MSDDLGEAIAEDPLEELPQPEVTFNPINPATWRDPSVVVEGFLKNPGPLKYTGNVDEVINHFGGYGFEQVDHGFGMVLYCHTIDGKAIVVPKGWWIIPGPQGGTFTVRVDHADLPTEKKPAPTFVSKPAEIRAIQFRGDNIKEIWDAFGTAGIYGPTEKNPNWLILTTTHGDTAPCRVGDWVVPDSRPDTFYPVKPEVFEKRWKAGSLVEEAANPTHRVSISVDVNQQQWAKIFGQFSELVENLGTEYPSAHVVSKVLSKVEPVEEVALEPATDSDAQNIIQGLAVAGYEIWKKRKNEDDLLVFNERTRLKLRNILYAQFPDFSQNDADDLIAAIVNSGIVFRERSGQ